MATAAKENTDLVVELEEGADCEGRPGSQEREGGVGGASSTPKPVDWDVMTRSQRKHWAKAKLRQQRKLPGPKRGQIRRRAPARAPDVRRPPPPEETRREVPQKKHLSNFD